MPPVQDPLRRYRLYVAMFVLNLAVVIGIIYLLRREEPRKIVVTQPPSRPVPNATAGAGAPLLVNAPTRALTAPAANNFSTSTPNPQAQAVAPAQSLTLSASPDSEKINLNTATLQELDTLPGIGPVLAQRILDLRTERGGFKFIAELLDVRGIGEGLYRDLQDLVTIE